MGCSFCISNLAGADVLVKRRYAHAQLGRGPRAHTDSDVVGAQLLQILVVHVDRADDHDVVGVEGVPVEGVAHRAHARGQPGRDLQWPMCLPVSSKRR